MSLYFKSFSKTTQSTYQVNIANVWINNKENGNNN